MSANPARGVAVLSAAFPARKYFHFAEADGARKNKASERNALPNSRETALRFDVTLGRVSLPDFADLLAHHGIALLAAKGLGKFRHIRKRSVPAETAQRMWIGIGHQAFVLGPIVRAPDLNPSQKKALLGSEAVLVRRTGLAFQRFLISGIGNRDTSKVCDAFAEDKLAIFVQVAVHDVAVELRFNARGTFLEILQIVGRPPVLQIAVAVKLAPLVVETVSYLVTDDRAHSAVVHGVVRFGIVEGRLQDSRGEDDFVHAAIVVSVHG